MDTQSFVIDGQMFEREMCFGSRVKRERRGVAVQGCGRSTGVDVLGHRPGAQSQFPLGPVGQTAGQRGGEDCGIDPCAASTGPIWLGVNASIINFYSSWYLNVRLSCSFVVYMSFLLHLFYLPSAFFANRSSQGK